MNEHFLQHSVETALLQRRKRRMQWLIILGTGAIAGCAGGWWIFRSGDGAEKKAAPAVAAKPPPPAPVAPAPPPPPLAPGRVAVYIDGTTLTSSGLRVVAAERSAVSSPLRARGVVGFDESAASGVKVPVEGTIDKLLVAKSGAKVRAGQALAVLASPSLVKQQEEFRALHASARAPGAKADDFSARKALSVARKRLLQSGLTRVDVERLERGGAVVRTLPLLAPRDGLVFFDGLHKGSAVSAGNTLFTVADTSTMWLMAEISPEFARDIRTGTPARVELPKRPALLNVPVAGFQADPGALLPTLLVRFVLPNPKGKLRAGEIASVELPVPARQSVVLPSDAVVHTGGGEHVFVETLAGRYEPRAVRLGAVLGDSVEIVFGVRPGDRVATSAVRMLDARSRESATGQPPQAGRGGT